MLLRRSKVQDEARVTQSVRGRAFSESVDDDVGGAPCVEPTDERTFDDSIKSKVWPG